MPAVSETVVHNSVLASTLARRSKGYVSQVGSQCPLWYWLRRKKRYVSKNGGTRLEAAVEYALDTDEPSTYGYDQLLLQPSDNVTIVFANWKEYYKPVVISLREKNMNTGKRIFDLLEQKEKNALTSLINQFNDHFYVDGTGNGGKRVVGLSAICPEAPTSGTLFGINRATAGNEWWRNRYKDSNAAAWDTTNSVPTMRNDMQTLYRECGRLKVGKQRHPDLILCTETYWDYYCTMTERIGRRMVNQKVAEAGYENAKFQGATLIADEDCPTDADSTQQAYFINSAFLKLFYHPRANLTVTDAQRMPDQNAFTQIIYWMGALLCTNCAKQGIHFGMTGAAA